MKLRTRLQLLITQIALTEANYKRHNAEHWERVHKLKLVELKNAMRKENA